MEAAEGASIAGVFTTNAFCAAPVTLTRKHLSHSPRYLLVNTGNANAGSGKPGMQAAISTCEALAKLSGVAPIWLPCWVMSLLMPKWRSLCCSRW